MERAGKIRHIAGILLALAVTAAVLAVFYALQITDMADVNLADAPEREPHWRYEVLVGGEVRQVEPAFDDTGIISLPGEPADAVRASRIMTETLEGAEVEFYPYNNQLEVYLDGELLWSDFCGLDDSRRNPEGFLLLTEQERAAQAGERLVRFTLPEDYTGKELSIITYYPADAQWRSPLFPFFGNSDGNYAIVLQQSVAPMVLGTICALLSVLTAVVFVLDMRNGKADAATPLLCLHFFMLFFSQVYGSMPGWVSVLRNVPDIPLLAEMSMAPLYLYLALHLEGRKKSAAVAAVGIWFVYSGAAMFLHYRQTGYWFVDYDGGAEMALLALMTALGLAELWEKKRRGESRPIPRYYWALVMAAIALRLIYTQWQFPLEDFNYLWFVFSSLGEWNWQPLVELIAGSSSIMAVIVLVLRYVRRTVHTGQMVTALQENSRRAMEGYERMLQAEESTAAVRHELLHHMTALAGLLDEGDAPRAREYIASVTDGLERLPTVRYSPNMLVNVVAGAYLDRAKAQGIRVEYSLPVPEKLLITDEDLSVFLTNMLENALNACMRVDPAKERFIRLKMRLHENFLLISCANSAPDGQEEKAAPADGRGRRHGYGMQAMERIAEKYGSILKIDKTAGEYSVKSNLCLQDQ